MELPWFFQKLRRGPGVAPLASPGLLPGRNCVSTKDRNVVGSNGDGGRGGDVRASRPRCARRDRAPGQEQSAAGISRTGAEDEHYGHGEGRGSGLAEWLGEGSKSSGRASGAGQRRAGRSQEVA